MAEIMFTPERLQREYFLKKEDAPLSENKGDFSPYGHRLSSLFHLLSLGVIWLTNRLRFDYSISKILNSNTDQKVIS
mgnify:CR=1 FL=1